MAAQTSHLSPQIQADKLMAGEEKRGAQQETFLKEQQNKREEVDEEHRKAMERLREQYSEMEKELAKYVSFWDLSVLVLLVLCQYSIASELSWDSFRKLNQVRLKENLLHMFGTGRKVLHIFNLSAYLC